MNNSFKIIETDRYSFCFSYGYLVAAYNKPEDNYYRTSQNWLPTTSKHVLMFVPKDRDYICMNQINLNKIYKEETINN